jgi:hypothetical protein
MVHGTASAQAINLIFISVRTSNLQQVSQIFNPLQGGIQKAFLSVLPDKQKMERSMTNKMIYVYNTTTSVV